MAPHRPLSHISSAPTYKRLRRPVPISFYRNAAPGQASSLFHACPRTTKRLPHARCVHAVAPPPRPLCARSLLPTTKRPRPHSPYSTLSALHQLPTTCHAARCRLSPLIIMTIFHAHHAFMHRHSSSQHVSALTVTSPTAQGHAPAVPTFLHTLQDRCALPAVAASFPAVTPPLCPFAHHNRLPCSNQAHLPPFPLLVFKLLPALRIPCFQEHLALHFVHTGHVKPAATTRVLDLPLSIGALAGHGRRPLQICVSTLLFRHVMSSMQAKGSNLAGRGWEQRWEHGACVLARSPRRWAQSGTSIE